MATTPTPDRVGDVVEPLGVEFKNPLPLLLYHDSRQPVGTVRFHKPTKDGVEFTAHIPTITEPQPLKDRVDEAWASIKAGLLKGVSIGFKPIEQSYNKDTGGFRFLRSEVLELSLVAIPANADATIATIKSFDTDPQSALRPAAPSSAGVPASRRPAGRVEKNMNLNAQITQLQNTRTATADRMKTLMDPTLNADGAMDAAQEKEYDGLVVTLEETDKQLRRLKALEQSQMVDEPLTPVSGTPRHVQVKEPELPPGIAFTRAVICKIAARLGGRDGNYLSAWEIAKQRYPSHPSLQTYLKTSIPMGTTTGTGSGSPQSGWGDDLATLATNFEGGFLEFLRPQTIIGKLNLVNTPFNSRVQSQTTGGTARWVGQGKAKPVTKYDFDAVTIGPLKLAAICVLADELIRFSSPNAETTVRRQLARTIIEKLDKDFIDPDVAAVAGVSPASITRGATVLNPSGTNLAAAITDITTMINTFITADQNIENLAWIMPNSTSLALSMMRDSLGNPAFPTVSVKGGTLAGYPVVASQYARGISTSPTDLNLVILLNQDEIFLADDGGVRVDASDQATIEMSDDPENEVGTQVSMFQNNAVALRAERYINWARGRTSSVVVMGDVRWAA